MHAEPGRRGARRAAHRLHYRCNDIASLEQAAGQAGGDLAALRVSPFTHDDGIDPELATPEFAQALRALCDRTAGGACPHHRGQRGPK